MIPNALSYSVSNSLFKVDRPWPRGFKLILGDKSGSPNIYSEIFFLGRVLVFLAYGPEEAALEVLNGVLEEF